ncbi:MAG TPA: hypothetical protein VGG69_02345 [Rhizomicrobium sp.]|jgi:hypothetical protein
MRYNLVTSAVLFLGLFAGTSAAVAAEGTDAICNQLDAQVRTALDASQQSPNRDQAMKERSTGRQFCSHGYYKVGGQHYSEALRLLGASSAQGPSGSSQNG